MREHIEGQRRWHCIRPLVLLSVLLSACTVGAKTGRSTPDAGAVDTVVLAAAWPWAAQPNMLYEKGMRLAIDEINAGGGLAGRPFRIERIDDHQSVDDGRLAAQRIAANGHISAVIGHMQSYITVPAAAVYDAAGIVLIAPTSTDVTLTSRGYHRVFRTTFTDRDAGREMADVAGERGLQRVGIFYIRNEYGRALSNAFEMRANSLGVDVVDRISYDPGSSNRSEVELIVRLWKERHIDGVFLAAEAGPAARFAQELAKQQMAVTMLGGDALGIPEFITEGGDAVNGLVLPAPFHLGDPRPDAQQFARAFATRFGGPPDAVAALGYDAVRVVARAMIIAGSTDAEKVSAAMRTMQQWRGATGAMAFDSTGDLTHSPITRVVIRSGTFAYLGAGRVAVGSPVPAP